MHDPFIQLTHLFSEDGAHRSSPLYVMPEKVTEILNGKIYLGSSSFVVREKAAEVHALIVAKLEENRQAETLGK